MAKRLENVTLAPGYSRNLNVVSKFVNMFSLLSTIQIQTWQCLLTVIAWVCACDNPVKAYSLQYPSGFSKTEQQQRFVI